MYTSVRTCVCVFIEWLIRPKFTQTNLTCAQVVFIGTTTAIRRMHFLCFLFLHLLNQVSAFSNITVKESIGGLITDPWVLNDRKQIDAETVDQVTPIVIVTTTAATYDLSLACLKGNLTFSQNSITPHLLVCNFTGHTDIPLSISFDTDISEVATLLPPFWMYLSPGSVGMTLNFTICRHRMGSVYLKVWVREAKPGGREGVLYSFDLSNDTSVKQYTAWLVNGSRVYEAGGGAAMGLHLKILRSRGIMETIFRVIAAVMVCALTLVMGCELDVMLIWKHFKKPVAPIIGFICQYGLMPLIAFGVAMVVPIKSEFGFGLLTTGCCPGGGGSNIWTLLLHGDLNLSMTMTFISSITALGMMPLMLFIYGRFFLDTRAIHIPYTLIAGQLCYVVIPVVLGMLIKWRFPNSAKRMVRLFLRPLAFSFIFIIIGFGIYVNLPIYALLGAYPLLFPIAAALPWIGFLLAGLFAFLCQRSRAEILTISIETGIQNNGIAILVLLYSMPQPEGDIGAAIPLVVGFITPFPLMIAYAVVAIREEKCSQCCRKKKITEVVGTDDEEQQKGLKSSSKDQNFETIIP
ncbi:sodium bile acid cotransporter [Echinococcus multilocularis]|uniref:Sodium bile acid cotransporter n=1 Tax=Echinococcus multilocularis TaxID=6211 RepID=A0A068YN26_ECHMU|nr:sodium bile acid cotransporter [Echinococcus multilocularis]